MQPKINTNKGSILVESLIGMTIVAIGSLAVMNLQGSLIRGNAQSNQKNEAMQIAKAKIEQLRNFETEAQYDNIATGSDTVSTSNQSYTRNWQVGDFLNPTYKTVNVSVSWTKQDGTTDSVSLSSRIVNQNPSNQARAISSTYQNQQSLNPANAQVADNGDPQPDATDTANVQTATLDDGTVVEYNSDTQEATIGGNVAVWISGTVTLAPSPDTPENIDINNVTVNTSGTGSHYCFYSVNVDTVNYTCVVQHTYFEGFVLVGGVTGVKLCASMPSNEYTAPLQSITGQDYQLFDSTSTCSGDTPNFITNL